MKSNLEYYYHRKDSHRHPKFKLLRALYGGGDKGWAFEGRFWALNNIISNSENCELDLTKKREKAVAAEELNLSLNELDNFIQTLLSDDIELLIETEPGIFTTKKVKEAFGKVSDEREKARIRKDKGKKTVSSDEINESSGEPDKRVKESKVNESREEKNNLVPSLSDVLSFFLEQKRTEKEAHKFYNYFQAKEWEGIKNWEPKALNWISEERNTSANGNNGNGFYSYQELLKKFQDGEKDIWNRYEPIPGDQNKRWRLKEFTE